jgi:dethiobiotin synthetase
VRPIGFIVTGTDTGVGKTFIASEILRSVRARGLRVGAYKPVASGARLTESGPIWDDVAILKGALGMPVSDDRICPQRFLAPLAPPIAARHEGRTVDGLLLREGMKRWIGDVDFVVVEGAGGLLSPLTDVESLADLARDLKLPLLIVARLSLGTINHTLLTLEAASHRNLPVAGIVLNEASPADPDDVSIDSNPAELQRRCPAPILAVVRYRGARGLLHESPAFKIDFVDLATRWCAPS